MTSLPSARLGPPPGSTSAGAADGAIAASLPQLPAQPPEVTDRRRLRTLLVDGPEALSAEGAEFRVEAGIGFISEPIRVWKATRFEPLTILGLTLVWPSPAQGSLRRSNVQLWQQNTSTRRLTADMLDAVFWRARVLLGGREPK